MPPVSAINAIFLIHLIKNIYICIQHVYFITYNSILLIIIFNNNNILIIYDSLFLLKKIYSTIINNIFTSYHDLLFSLFIKTGILKLLSNNNLYKSPFIKFTINFPPSNKYLQSHSSNNISNVDQKLTRIC